MGEEISGEGWIDVSVPLYSGMVHWPDNPPVRVDVVMDMDRGDVCTVSTLSMGSHTGTHMDAPRHFVQGAATMDEMPFAATIGRARVVEIEDQESIKPGELESKDVGRGERLLFKTRNSSRCWSTNSFIEDFVYISPEAGQYLAERGVRTVGVDYLSVGGYQSGGPETHRALLGAGIWLIEGLNLSSVGAGTYDLICLPIRVRQAEGTLCRAILRPA